MTAPFESPSLPAADSNHARNLEALSPQTRHNSEKSGAHVTGEWAAVWEQCRTQLATEIAPAFFEKFINSLHCAGLDANGELCLLARDTKLQRHVEQRYLPLIRTAVHAAAANQGSTAISGARIAGPDALAADLQTAASVHVVPVQPGSAATAQSIPGTHNIQGDLAVPAMQAQASLGNRPTVAAPAPTANPARSTISFALPGHEAAAVNRPELDRLWQGAALQSGCLSLIGPSGSGKTAIARAYAAHIQRQGESVRYLTAEEFLTEFSLACRKRENIAWRETLRSHRVLIIDDFQFIKPQAARSQEELQYLIDAFLNSGRLLILCSDRDAVAQGLTPALASRLQAGDRILLAYPEQSEREAIVQHALSTEAAAQLTEKLDLAEEQIRYLAARIQRDMRHLKSAVRRLAQGQSLRGTTGGKTEWNVGTVDQLCGDLYTRRPTIAPATVRQAVAKFCQVDEAEITGPRRDRRYTRARHLTAYLCLEYLQLSQKETATVIGRQEHGSVVHARKKIEELLAEDLFLRRQISELAESIFGG